ncbi:MAG: hypothetical protein COB27_010205 [Moritella sp.]|uniref:hypothetical protein n=1 Tax=unclassified Moritella TaxID=2637987 RepID=UPI000694908E|nr:MULTISPECIES: hypothetical protein [unclassified Moritella]MBL1417237.1 hypothetical protein [Moritella sp.]
MKTAIIMTTALMSSSSMVSTVSINELRGFYFGDAMVSSKSDDGLLAGEVFTATAKIETPCTNYGDSCMGSPLKKFRRTRVNSNYIIFKQKTRLSLR